MPTVTEIEALAEEFQDPDAGMIAVGVDDQAAAVGGHFCQAGG